MDQVVRGGKPQLPFYDEVFDRRLYTETAMERFRSEWAKAAAVILNASASSEILKLLEYGTGEKV